MRRFGSHDSAAHPFMQFGSGLLEPHSEGAYLLLGALAQPSLLGALAAVNARDMHLLLGRDRVLKQPGVIRTVAKRHSS